MNATATPSPAAPSAPSRRGGDDQLARELGALLADLTVVHEQLLTASADQRSAIAAADPLRLEVATRRYAELGVRLQKLEQDRAALTRRDRGTTAPVTLGDLAAALPEPQRPAITQSAARLKALVKRVADEQAVIGRAAAALLSHTDGLLRQVGRRLNPAGTYTSRGTVTPGAAALGVMDLTR